MRELILLLLSISLVSGQLYVGFSGFGKVHFASLQGISDLNDGRGVSTTTENIVRGGGGVGVELGLNQYLGIQTGFWYIKEGGKAIVSYTAQKNKDEFLYDFSSIKLPLFLRVGEGIASQKVFFSAYLGPQFVFSGNRVIYKNGGDITSDTLLSSFKSNYIEIAGRIQIDIPLSKYTSISLALGGDYSVSNIYSPVNATNNDISINPLNFGFYFGVTRIIALKSLRKVWF